MAGSIAEQDAQRGGVLQRILYARELAVAWGGVYPSDEARLDA